MSRAELEAELEARGEEPIGEKDELQVRPAGSMPLSLCCCQSGEYSEGVLHASAAATYNVIKTCKLYVEHPAGGIGSNHRK